MIEPGQPKHCKGGAQKYQLETSKMFMRKRQRGKDLIQNLLVDSNHSKILPRYTAKQKTTTQKTLRNLHVNKSSARGDAGSRRWLRTLMRGWRELATGVGGLRKVVFPAHYCTSTSPHSHSWITKYRIRQRDQATSGPRNRNSKQNTIQQCVHELQPTRHHQKASTAR